MKSSTSNKLHWLEVAEITSVVVSIGGSVVGVLLKQFLWAAIPLSASAGFAIANHQRLKRLIKEERQTIAILVKENKAALSELKIVYAKNHQKNKSSWAELEDELGQVRNLATTELTRLQLEKQEEFEHTALELSILTASVAKLDDLSQKLEQNLNVVDEKQQETGRLVRELKAIDIFTQNIKADLNSVQSYFERGYAYQRLDNKHRAIDDYTKALELDSNHVKAYHNRGLLYVELGLSQKAVIDLRRASQLYFDQGNLDRYRETRDLSLRVHQDQAEGDPKIKQQDLKSVSVGNLFD
jgi:tetratricopeptide (TPR) repeat protein